MRRRPGPAIIVEQTIERRTVLEWLGKAAVLAIGGELVAACSVTGAGGLATGPDGGADGGLFDAGCAPDDFPWQPGAGEHAVFEGWGERTVDEQDLTQILQSWNLTVDGLVAAPTTLSFAELLQPLLSATHVTFTCVGDTYRESLPLDVALEPRTLLGYGIDCNTLPLAHGFPLRIVVPRKWGYKNPKYVYRIELADGPVQGFWEQYGYPYDGDVPQSRLREGKY